MIEVIAGTTRPGSATLKVAKLIVRMYNEAGASAQLMDLQALPQQIFLPSAFAEKPASFAPFQERILRAHGLHVVVPEYNGSFPGVLKHFIDMLKFPESFEERPVAYTGVAAGVWGGLRAVEQLQMVFGYRNGFNLPHRTFISAVHKKLDEAGELNDAFTADLLRTEIREFIKFAAAHKRADG
ncbi:MAG: NAD(P)H-dependent oxidoreductase [Candidatus Sumerlaeia bacterium]|nr:NAD(P)H-dependent oxidoreductase [Candidatus Sumerlaeia bacterium]